MLILVLTPAFLLSAIPVRSPIRLRSGSRPPPALLPGSEADVYVPRRTGNKVLGV